MVGQHGVVGEQPVGQFLVEGSQVVEEEVLMIVHERFLEGEVEAFGVGVHFRRAGVRPPVGDAAFLQTLLEVAQKLRAVVGEDEPWGGLCGAGPRVGAGPGHPGGPERAASDRALARSGGQWWRHWESEHRC